MAFTIGYIIGRILLIALVVGVIVIFIKDRKKRTISKSEAKEHLAQYRKQFENENDKSPN